MNPVIRGRWGEEKGLKRPELVQVPILATQGSTFRGLIKLGYLWARLGPNSWLSVLYPMVLPDAVLYLTLFSQHCEVEIISLFSRLENRGSER